jgi:hypothetical protein
MATIGKEDMKIAIYDKGGGGFRAEAAAAAIAVLGSKLVTVLVAEPSSEILDKLRQHTHVVCHLSGVRGESGTWPELLAGCLSKMQVIIRVSSQGGASGMSDSLKAPYRHNDTGPWILHMIEPSGSVDRKWWESMVRTFQEWDTSQPELPGGIRSIFDSNAERLALRLLCEAWIATKGEPEATLGGIEIHAPTNSTCWLQPFGEDQGIDQLATRLGETKDRRDRVTELLNSAASETLTWEGSREVVEGLRDALKEAAR